LGSGFGLALVLFGSGITGIWIGAGSGYRGLGRAEIIGVEAAAGVGCSLGLFTGAGEAATFGEGIGVGWVVMTGGGVTAVGVGVGVTTAVGG
jgi:hypothetical protein